MDGMAAGFGFPSEEISAFFYHTGQLKRVEHLFSLRFIRQLAQPGLNVVLHVFGIGSAGNNTGNRGVAENVLQKKLPPAMTVEFLRPGGKVLAAHPAEK